MKNVTAGTSTKRQRKPPKKHQLTRLLMRSQSVSLYRLRFSLQCLGSHQICSVIVYSRFKCFQRCGAAGGSGGKYPSRRRGKTQNVFPASAVTLTHKRDEHNELQYRLAGSMNINTDAARRGAGLIPKKSWMDSHS